MNKVNSRLRCARLSIARSKGRHTKAEWLELKEFFCNTCVRCLGEKENTWLEKDHIIPIYLGGSDSIRNIQPLCNRCNSSKGAETIDWRQIWCDVIRKELPEKWRMEKEVQHG